MPFGRLPARRDLGRSAGQSAGLAAPSNQSSPLLVSTRGRFIWSQRPFAFAFAEGQLRASGREVLVCRGGRNLREAYLAACHRFFPPAGRAPARFEPLTFCMPCTSESSEAVALGLVSAGQGAMTV
jgi:hypothetical protein